MPSPEKFEETLHDFSIHADIIEAIYNGFGPLTSRTAKKEKTAFFRHALSVMNDTLSKEQVKTILEANACCKSGARLRNSKEFAKVHAALNMEERLKLISQRPYMNMGKAELDEQGFLIVHAVSYQPADKFECACPTISKIKHTDHMPKEYCYCCGGHFKYHYEIMLDTRLETVEIVSSPHDTDGCQPCIFKYQIKPKMSCNR